MHIRPRRRKPMGTAPVQSADDPPLRTRSPFAIGPTPGNVEPPSLTSPPLSNPRHELFAQAIVSGMDRAAAYAHAGYDNMAAYSGATQLLSRVDVANRITQLQRRSAERAAVTVETLVDELEEARISAKALDQPAAMVAATKEKAVLLGLRVEKSDITKRDGDPKGLTDDELAAIARKGRDGADPATGDPDGPAPMVH